MSTVNHVAEESSICHWESGKSRIRVLYPKAKEPGREALQITETL